MTGADVRRLDEKLAAALPPGRLYAVGGRVRDELRQAGEGIAVPIKDLDYVVAGLELRDLEAKLQKIGRTDVVGAAFAVIKCTIDGLTVDVALPRRERSTGVGHRDFAVESGADVPLEDDLARRDFRMNMIARSLPSGELVDPYDGQTDISARRIDVLRSEAFTEDPLRMLRACQFAARFSYSVSPRTLAAMAAAAPLIATVSPERVRDELVKLLSAPRPSDGIELMREARLLVTLLPEVAEGVGIEQNAWHAYDVYRHSLATLDAATPGDLVLRLAALFHDVAKPRTKDGPHFYRHEIVGEEMSKAILGRFRFPNDTIEDVAALVRQHMYAADPGFSDQTIRRFVRRVGLERLARQFALREADIVGSGLPKRDDRNERFEVRVAAILAERPPLSAKDLAITGSDVLAELVLAEAVSAASQGSPRVGAILRTLLDRVIDDPACNERDYLLGAVREIIGEDAASPPATEPQ